MTKVCENQSNRRGRRTTVELVQDLGIHIYLSFLLSQKKSVMSLELVLFLILKGGQISKRKTVGVVSRVSTKNLFGTSSISCNKTVRGV